MGKVVITTPAITYPITVSEVKEQTIIDSGFTADDTLIEAMIKAATGYAEAYCRRKFITATITEYYNAFPVSSKGFELSFKAIAVNSVKYKDSDNTEQTWAAANYQADLFATPTEIREAYNKTYPLTYNELNTVYVEYTTGYGAAAAVPQEIKQALLLMVADMYENRTDSIERFPKASQVLLNIHQITQL